MNDNHKWFWQLEDEYELHVADSRAAAIEAAAEQLLNDNSDVGNISDASLANVIVGECIRADPRNSTPIIDRDWLLEKMEEWACNSYGTSNPIFRIREEEDPDRTTLAGLTEALEIWAQTYVIADWFIPVGRMDASDEVHQRVEELRFKQDQAAGLV